jgi:hypothetical protein
VVLDTTMKKERASGWARFGFSTGDRSKLRKAGLLSKVAEIRIPGDEAVPRLNVGF